MVTLYFHIGKAFPPVNRAEVGITFPRQVGEVGIAASNDEG